MSHKIFEMPVANVYVHYVNKVERKDRTEAELIKVITWLTGFDSKTLKSHLKKHTTFKEFFKAAKIHPNAKLITGSICGVKIIEIEDPLMKKIRYMDKLVDELATQRTIKIGPYPFYEQPLSISPKEIEDLRSLVTSADAYMAYGPKLCGPSK